MASTFAYIALFGWPLVVFLLFRFLPRTPALIWSLIGGYLALPFGVGVNLPTLPTFDKTLIPALSATVMCLLGVAPFATQAHRTARTTARKTAGLGAANLRRAGGVLPRGPAPEGQAEAGSIFTRQKTRRPARGTAGPDAVERGVLRHPSLIIMALMALMFVTQILTFVQNTEPTLFGVLTLPGLSLYDAFSMMLSTAVSLLPFALGLFCLGRPEDQTLLLRILCIAALIYSLPTLFEIRMSPQLARWTYGFLYQSFAQAVRDGGFRPVVFLQHGLWLALFMAMAALAALALWRQSGQPNTGLRLGLMAALWLTGVLVLSRSFGAFALLLALSPVLVMASVRGQLLMAAVLAVVVLIYPMLRGAGLVPVEAVYAVTAAVSGDRAQSVKFRFDNEDILLDRANLKPLAGWGGYSRSRVFDTETGRDVSVTDGAWIIIMGNSGWLGYLATFGLLTLPVILLFLGSKKLGLDQATAGLCLVLMLNLLDMIPNATLTPITWLIAGALAGRCRFSLVLPQFASGGRDAPEPTTRVARVPPQRRDLPHLRPATLGPSGMGPSGLRRALLAVTVLFAGLGAPARADLSNPTLSFGLSGISDWSTQMPFRDIMKYSRSWIGHEPGKWGGMTAGDLAAGGYLDADGWPMRMPPELGAIGTIWDWGGSAWDPAAAASRAGIYVLSYEGRGKLEVGGDVKVLNSRPGQMLFENLTGASMWVNIIETDPGQTGDYVRNITVARQELAVGLAAGQIFSPAWLAVVQDARELRFMDWMNTNGATSASWEDRPLVDDVRWDGGVPVEVMVTLANQTGTEPWFTMPAGADEAYIRNFATYVRDNLDPGLEVHVEYSNEMWNWAFVQTHWLSEQAKTVWQTEDGAAWLDYAAMLATRSALIWDDVFGAEAAARIDHVMGTQTANSWIAERLLAAPLWQEMDPEGYVAPSTVFDSLAVTTYFGGSTMGDEGPRVEFLAVLKTPGIDATAWLTGKLMDPAYGQSIPMVMEWWAANRAVADQYGLDLIAYEGGQHVLHSFAVDGMTEEDLNLLTGFLAAFVRSQAMADLYQTLWTAWTEVSDGPFMHFTDVAAASKWGAWGLFSALGDRSPRADLVMRLNASTEPWFSSP